MKKQICSLVFLFAVMVNISAQADTTLYRIDEVVISGMRTQTNRNNVPMTISVVNRQQIEESSESALLPVLSGRVPGMFVTQRGVAGFGVGSSGSGTMTLRGVGVGNELLVLIDGHPQYMGVMGHHLADAYVASDVEKVEVIRGPASILYGSNAMGGVINIITRKQDAEGWNANGRVMYGSYNTQKYQVSAGLKKGKFSGLLSINHDRTDGHRKNQLDGDRLNSKFHITNGYVKLGYQISGHFQAWGDVSLAAFETQSPGSLSAPLFGNVANILRGVASVTVENTYDKTNGAFKVFYNFGDHKIDDGYNAGGTPSPFHFRSNDHNYGITWYQIFRLFAGNMITAGVDYKNFGGRAWDKLKDNTTTDRVWADTTLYEIAGYVVMQQTLLEKLTLNAGVRLENNEQFGSEWIPQAGLAYRPFRHTVLKGSVSKGFRSPNIQDLYYLAGWAGHNPDLKPEKMVNFEVSLGQAILDGRLSAELTWFTSKGDNIIVADWSNGYPPTKYNSGDFKNSGIEFSFNYNVLKNLHVNGNYSFLKMDKTIEYSPEQQMYLAGFYRWKKWGVSANYRYIHDLHNNVDYMESAVSYGLLDAKLSYRPLTWLNVFVKGENLTDKTYQTRFDFPMPGITVFGGINISLK
ncbi:MAG: TonB-dependent receptor [Bacteroidales bacterium]|jgi:iron complex outermembrane receptor protein|nr:TonB-dependent receptor [Bacteroidales bacterium]